MGRRTFSVKLGEILAWCQTQDGGGNASDTAHCPPGTTVQGATAENAPNKCPLRSAPYRRQLECTIDIVTIGQGECRMWFSFFDAPDRCWESDGIAIASREEAAKWARLVGKRVTVLIDADEAWDAL